MKKIIIPLIILPALMWGCSGSAADDSPATGIAAGGRADITLYAPQDQSDVSVLVFRKSGDAFVYDSAINDGWIENEGRMEQTLSMELGYYKFLFASGFGDNLQLSPSPVRGETAFESMQFTLSGNSDGTFPAADELFLQPTLEERSQTYLINAPRSIDVTLRRAVSRIVLQLKQGYIEDGVEVEQPLERGTIVDDIDNIVFTVNDSGKTLTIDGGEKGARVPVTFDTAAATLSTDTGFATFVSPFLLPVGDDHVIDADVTVNYTQASGKSAGQGHVSGVIAPNKQLNVRLYIKKDEQPLTPVIQITADTSDIEDETDGDNGLWN